MDRTGHRLAVTALCALLLLFVGCSETASEPPDTQPGDVVDARDESAANNKRSRIVVPAGRLEVRFGEPVTRLDDDQTSDLTSRDAPDGGSFVPIVWSFDDDVFGDLAMMFGERRALEVELVADGNRYSLSPPSADLAKEETAEFVAVDGAADKVRLEVSYDGVTQTLDADTGELDRSRAKGLYELVRAKVKPRKCPSKAWFTDPTALVGYECEYSTALPSPYVANAWADPGHTWLSVYLVTNLTNFVAGAPNGAVAYYRAETSSELSNVDGRKPIGTLEEVVSGGAASGTLVFDIEGRLPDRLEVRRSYRLTLTGAVGKMQPPQQRDVKIGGDIKLVY